MPDIIPFLLRLREATLFTVDRHFYQRTLCHAKYALAFLDADQTEAAHYMRRVLRHPAFDSQAKRLGLVIRASVTHLEAWRLRAAEEERFAWMD